MDSSPKIFKCRIHPEEPIRRISIREESEGPLRCIECVLLSSQKLGRENFLTFHDFIERAAKYYESLNSISKISDEAPQELTEFLSDEEETLQKLEKIIEEEKKKVNEVINSIVLEFSNLCNQKREEANAILDKQLINLKTNYAYYKSKLNKYYGNSNDDTNGPSKDALIEKIQECESYDQLDLLIKNIKDDMNEANYGQDTTEKINEIKEGMKDLGEILKMQSKDLPKFVMGNPKAFDESFKKFTKLVIPKLEEFVSVEPTIDEISLGLGGKIDSKIITKFEEKKLLKQWLGKSKLVLIYRASRDGFNMSGFASKMGTIAPTLTIIRSNYKKIFGGYADQNWQVVSNYKNSNKTWLFSMDNKEKYPIKPANATYSIYTNTNYGPTFGGGHDIYIANNCNNGTPCYSNFGHSYETGKQSANPKSALAGAYNFGVEELEVFQVI